MVSAPFTYDLSLKNPLTGGFLAFDHKLEKPISFDMSLWSPTKDSPRTITIQNVLDNNSTVSFV